ncbi:potassium channel family protein [Methanococcoides burtonii]|uniref:Protein with ion channel domain n=1 Tax=Methanococcoides burtonii (strain DSM 6242 / NBRC 107633 / OCM 468 / ACE-M) TaxID=259564 RepID=Q12UE6_METBU|nr:potassium channel family protein [Methanococcoides burtonii]ABE52930.1 protein with ion channel domain [Methanococcoides burtonii DSM 6242]
MHSSPFTRVLHESFRKIVLFIFTLLSLTIISGVLMYFIEGRTGGFANIPDSIYWAITTLTTIGYGDIVPQTDIGRAVNSIITLLGSSIIIIPIVIVIGEIYNSLYKAISGGSEDK